MLAVGNLADNEVRYPMAASIEKRGRLEHRRLVEATARWWAGDAARPHIVVVPADKLVCMRTGAALYESRELGERGTGVAEQRARLPERRRRAEQDVGVALRM